MTNNPLLAQDGRELHRLLKHSDHAEQLEHVGPHGLTSLHLAVLCCRRDLLARLAAVGAPLDAAVGGDFEKEGDESFDELPIKADPSVRVHLHHGLALLRPGVTPLALAARQGTPPRCHLACLPAASMHLGASMHQGQTQGISLPHRCSMKSLDTVQELLRLGADPCGGSHGVTPLTGLKPGAADAIAEAILRAGGDCLARCQAHKPGSWLAHFVASGRTAAADCLLARMEQQRAVGLLCLGDSRRAAQLLQCAVERRHGELTSYALGCLQQHVAEAAGQLPSEDGDVLGSVLHAAMRQGSMQLLQRLLGSGLPLDLWVTDHRSRSLLSVAATVAPAGAVAGLVRLLCQAGAETTASDLLRALDQLSAEGVEALLACGVPAVNTRRPSLRVVADGWSCPVHRTLHTLADKARPQRLLPLAGGLPCSRSHL